MDHDKSGRFSDELAHLATLRDELRVKLHLAGMDARDAYRELDHEADAVLRDAASASRRVVRALVEKLRKATGDIGSHPVAR
jgi:hypothetical protein